jgi:putative tricarboxylic transport membrane protein
MAETTGQGPDKAVVAIGIGLLAVAGVVVWQAFQVRASFGSQAIGPQMMPFVVGILLAVFGVLTVLEGLKGLAPPREADDWHGVVWIAGGLAVMILLIKTAGFVPAAAVLFASTARAFGSTRTAVDFAIGAAMAIIIYLFFVKILGLSLPSGFTESWI